MAQIFTTQLAINCLFKFPLHPMSAYALPGKSDQAKGVSKWMKNVDKLYLSRSVAPDSLLITRFDCHAAMFLSDDVQKCFWIQETTDKVCISLEKNIIDTADSKWKKRLYVWICTMGWLTFWVILLQAVDKWNSLMKCQPMCHICKQNVFLCVI